MVLLTAPGNDPGPAGAMYLAFQKLAAKKRPISSKVLEEVAALMGMRREGLSEIADLFDGALQSGRAVPLRRRRPCHQHLRRPARCRNFWPGGWPTACSRKNSPGRVACRSRWGERYGAAFKTIGGRGRVRQGPTADGVPGARVRHGRGTAGQ